MSTRGQILVAVIATGVGLAALGIAWLITTPETTNQTVAIGTLVYAAGYVLAVPRAERWLARFPVFIADDGEAMTQA